MRISLCNEVIRELPFPEQCAFARETGYDGLEIAPFTLGGDPHLMPPARRAELRRAAADAGIRITGLHYLLIVPEGLSITAPDAGVRARTVDVMRRLCDLAADLGAGLLVHGSPAQRRLAPGREPEGRRHAVDSFAAVADAAEKAGVVYCIEPLARQESNIINTVAEAAEIVHAIGSPAVRTMIDCSAAARGEELPIPDLVARWLPTGLVAHIHLNDPNRQGPGDGSLAFAPILRALADGGYAGAAAIEPFVYQPDGPTCAARNIRHIRGLQEVLP